MEWCRRGTTTIALPISPACSTAPRRSTWKYQGLAEEHAQVSTAAFIADISQNPDARNRSSTLVPAATRSSVFVSLTKAKVFTPLEVDATLGYPGVVTGGEADMYLDLVATSTPLSQSDRCSLSGNSLHLACAAAWELYVCSHLVRRELLVGFTPQYG